MVPTNAAVPKVSKVAIVNSMSMIVIQILVKMAALAMIWLMTSVVHALMELLDCFVKSMSMNVSMELVIMEVHVWTKLEAMSADVDQDMWGQDVRVMLMNV